MTHRFPDYDVLTKRNSPSWNEKTREVIDTRLAQAVPVGVMSATQLATLKRLVERICPDPDGRPPTNTVALVARRIADNECDGYRHHALPAMRHCWLRALDCIDVGAQHRHDTAFACLSDAHADDLLHAIESGETEREIWLDLPSELFWSWRLIPDLVSAHWAQPSLWSDMGFGGPASPRGYVRLGLNRRDPWEAEEKDGGPKKGMPRHPAS